MQVAGDYSSSRVGELSEDEPDHAVQHVVQSERKQQAVQSSERESAGQSRAEQPLSDSVDGILNRRPCVSEHKGQHDACYGGRYRDEPFTPEESKNVGESDVVVLVVQHTGGNSGDNARQHSHVDRRVDRDYRLGKCEVAYRAREGRRAAPVECHSDRDSDREQKRQVVEDRRPRLHHKRNIQNVVRAKPQ